MTDPRPCTGSPSDASPQPTSTRTSADRARASSRRAALPAGSAARATPASATTPASASSRRERRHDASARRPRVAHIARPASPPSPTCVALGTSDAAALVRTKLLPLVEADDADHARAAWFSLGAVGRLRSRDDTDPAPCSFAGHPRLDAQDRPRKYEFLAGANTVIDIHPATPHDWILGARRSCSRGHHQGRRSLSAQLAAHFDDDELRFQGTPEQATARLRALLEQIPAHERCATSRSPASATAQEPEWNAFRFDDRTVLVAFDGDVHTNRQVRKQAGQLFDWLSGNKNAPPC